MALSFKEEEGKWSLFAFDARPAALHGMDGDWYRERAKTFSELLTVPVHYVGIVMTGEGLGVEVRYSTGHSDITSEEAKTERYLVYNDMRRSFPKFEGAFGAVYVGSVNHSGDGFSHYELALLAERT